MSLKNNDKLEVSQNTKIQSKTINQGGKIITDATISNINCSLANALRRVILANIPTVVFRTSPYEKNDATFHINTSRLNNEILKQRLSCIPIHISDMENTFFFGR